MKRTIALLIFAVIFASMLVVGLVFRSGNAGLVPNVQAKEKGCTLATLQGDYLVTSAAQARFDQSDDPTFPRVSAGVNTFDGEGHMSGFNTASQGGQITRRQLGRAPMCWMPTAPAL